MSNLEDWKAQQKQNDQFYARVYGKCPVCNVKLETKTNYDPAPIEYYKQCPKCGDKY